MHFQAEILILEAIVHYKSILTFNEIKIKIPLGTFYSITFLMMAFVRSIHNNRSVVFITYYLQIP